MDRIIEVKVNGNYLTKDNKVAGVQHEANVTFLRIEFDESWLEYAKKVTWWNALGEDAVEITLTTALLEDAAASMLIYLCPIPGEALTVDGMCSCVIDGYMEGKRMRSVGDEFQVKYSPYKEAADEPADPTPSQAEQLQAGIDAINEIIGEAAGASNTAAAAAKAAAASATAAAKSESAASAAAENAAEAEKTAAKAAAAIENMGVEAETRDAGEEAGVEKLVDEDGNVTLKFYLPRGEQGVPGEPGKDGSMSFEDLTEEQKESLKAEIVQDVLDALPAAEPEDF